MHLYLMPHQTELRDAVRVWPRGTIPARARHRKVYEGPAGARAMPSALDLLRVRPPISRRLRGAA